MSTAQQAGGSDAGSSVSKSSAPATDAVGGAGGVGFDARQPLGAHQKVLEAAFAAAMGDAPGLDEGFDEVDEDGVYRGLGRSLDAVDYGLPFLRDPRTAELGLRAIADRLMHDDLSDVGVAGAGAAAHALAAALEPSFALPPPVAAKLGPHMGHLGHGSECARCAELQQRVQKFFSLPAGQREAALRVSAADVLTVTREMVSCPGCVSGVNQILCHPTLQWIEDSIGPDVLSVEPSDGGLFAHGDGAGGGGGKARRGKGGAAEASGDDSGSGHHLCLCSGRASKPRRLTETLQLFELESWMESLGVKRHSRAKAVRRRCQYHVAVPDLGYDWEDIIGQWEDEDQPMLELTCIPIDELDSAVDTLLHVHRFCKECAHNVNIAYHRLVGRPDPVEPAPDDETFADDLFGSFARGVTFGVPARPGQDRIMPGRPAIYVDPANVYDLISRGVRDSHDDEDAVALGQHPDHRHATTLYQGQMQVLSCIGTALLRRLLKAQQVSDTIHFLHELTVRTAMLAFDQRIGAAVQASSQEELVKELLELSVDGTGAAASKPAKLSKKARKRAAKERRLAEKAAKASASKASEKKPNGSSSSTAADDKELAVDGGGAAPASSAGGSKGKGGGNDGKKKGKAATGGRGAPQQRTAAPRAPAASGAVDGAGSGAAGAASAATAAATAAGAAAGTAAGGAPVNGAAVARTPDRASRTEGQACVVASPPPLPRLPALPSTPERELGALGVRDDASPARGSEDDLSMLLQVDEAELQRMKAQREAHRAKLKARFSEWCKEVGR